MIINQKWLFCIQFFIFSNGSVAGIVAGNMEIKKTFLVLKKKISSFSFFMGLYRFNGAF